MLYHFLWHISIQSKLETNLYLAGNNNLIEADRLTDADCLMLYKVLKTNMYVTGLDLRYNRITDIGAQSIANLLQETPILKCLNLMGNDIGESGAAFLAKSLHVRRPTCISYCSGFILNTLFSDLQVNVVVFRGVVTELHVSFLGE